MHRIPHFTSWIANYFATNFMQLHSLWSLWPFAWVKLCELVKDLLINCPAITCVLHHNIQMRRIRRIIYFLCILKCIILFCISKTTSVKATVQCMPCREMLLCELGRVPSLDVIKYTTSLNSFISFSSWSSHVFSYGAARTGGRTRGDWLSFQRNAVQINSFIKLVAVLQ